MRSPDLIKEKVKEYQKGINPDGSTIGFYRSQQYSLFKRQKNPLAGGTVDLILTGGFTRGLFVENKHDNVFNFDSHDEKAPDLFIKYGDDQQGLSDITWIKLQKDKLAPELLKFILRYINR